MPKTMSKPNRGKQTQYREVLEEKVRTLRANMSTPTAQVVARAEEPNDYGDLAERSHEEWLFLNRNEATARQLREIKEALARLDDGSFGICAECDKPITPKRLEAVPWAKYCIHCQEQHGSWTN